MPRPDHEAERDGGGETSRSWMLSPAIATLIFVGAQFFMTVTSKPHGPLRAAAADAPAGPPVQVRVVSAIRSLDEDVRPAAPVPRSERELLNLFKSKRCVVFDPSEVDALGTQERRFGADEVDVITPEGRRR